MTAKSTDSVKYHLQRRLVSEARKKRLQKIMRKFKKFLHFLKKMTTQPMKKPKSNNNIIHH